MPICLLNIYGHYEHLWCAVKKWLTRAANVGRIGAVDHKFVSAGSCAGNGLNAASAHASAPTTIYQGHDEREHKQE